MAFAPVYMKDCLLTIDGDEFQAEVSAAAITPSNTTAVWKGLTPTSRHTATGTDWQVDLTVGQDYDTATSLARFLLEHAGENKAVTLKPRALGVGYGVTATIAPVAIGGGVEAFAEGTVTLPCDKPAILGA